eukprot:PhM_4_TR6074/c0_g1_i1/m.2705/K01113/phoD; alkaline phosphatase D
MRQTLLNIFIICACAAISSLSPSAASPQSRTSLIPPRAPKASAAQRSTLRFAFGSCNKPDYNQSVWGDLLAVGESSGGGDAHRGWDLFAWLGDVVYNDNRTSFPLMRFSPNPIEEVRRRYNMQRSNRLYAQLAATTPIIGVWDDHDFGLNDADKTFADKDVNQEAFLDFLGVERNAPIRRQAGVYTYQLLETPNEAVPGLGRRGRVLIVLLDNRYHKDPYGTEGGDFLGEAQWAWLESLLRDVPADVTIIGSGIQVINDVKPSEHWGRFPAARQRMLDLIAQTRRERVLFLSGDIHIAELNVAKCTPSGYPLYDLTSSGITHANPSFLSYLSPTSPMLLGHYYGKNFGGVEVDFSKREVRLSVWGEGAVRVLFHVIKFSELELSIEKPSCGNIGGVDGHTLKVVRHVERANRAFGFVLSSTQMFFLSVIIELVVVVVFVGVALKMRRWVTQSFENERRKAKGD